MLRILRFRIISNYFERKDIFLCSSKFVFKTKCINGLDTFQVTCTNMHSRLYHLYQSVYKKNRHLRLKSSRHKNIYAKHQKRRFFISTAIFMKVRFCEANIPSVKLESDIIHFMLIVSARHRYNIDSTCLLSFLFVYWT